MSIGTIWTYRDLIKREQGLEAAIEFEQVVKKYQAEQIAIERERIIKLLEGFDDSCLWRQVEWSPDAYEGFNMQDLISLIKGEQDEDACEPSDSPCVNGWSCQKHRMTIEQLIDFLAEINGENK